MKLKIALIRNGQAHNAEDDSLGGEGERLIREKCGAEKYPAAKHVYSGGSSCCRETANIIYPGPTSILRELSVDDRVDLIGHAPSAIPSDKALTNWSEPQALRNFTDSDTLYDTDTKAKRAVLKISAEMEKKKEGQCAVITNKMIILAILRRYCIPRSGYADWEIPFGGGYLIEYDTVDGTAKLIKKI